MAKKASDHIQYFQNPNGPTITTVARPILEQDGLYFKDIDGTGKVSPVNDWRLSPEERAAAYVKQMTVEEKIGQLFISDWRMGPKYPSARLRQGPVYARKPEGRKRQGLCLPGCRRKLLRTELWTGVLIWLF